MESYAAVRRFVFIDGHSRREAARVFGLRLGTVAKMCWFSLPPGIARKELAAKPKDALHVALELSKRRAPRTTKRRPN